MNMKKKILSAAVLATLGAGSAQAVYLGTDGTGQVLIFPYYTVQGNEETLLTVVNTHNEGKAVKIRFREAENSREVLDFNIYLSPYDVWVGKITDNDAGDGAAVVSPDTTCTVPVQISQGQKIDFRPYAYNGVATSGITPPNPDSGTQDLSRTREGYVEILEMGVIDDSAVWDADADGNLDYVHINGVPDNCAGIQSNLATILGTANAGLNAPTGGLFGQLSIINVPNGTEVGENATALEDVYSTQQHADTGTLQPTLGDADATSYVLDVPAGGIPTLYADDWTPDEGGIDAVSAVLMSGAIANTYTVNSAVEASTAWVVTFPTKWYYTQAVDTDGSGTIDNGDAIRPFTHVFLDGQACEQINVSAYDREEKTVTSSGADFSPQPGIPGIHLCYEVNVIQFENSNVLSAANTVLKYTGLPGEAGWAMLSFPTTGGIHQMVGPDTGITYNGLPVIGFSTSILQNSNVGVGAAYGDSNSHTYLRNRTL